MTELNESLHHNTAEQSVIGSALLDPSILDNVSLRASMFYHKHHQVIWSEIIRLKSEHKNIDFLTLAESLESVGKLADVGGEAYLVDLVKNTPSSRNASAYSKIVIERAKRRKAIDLHKRIIERYCDLNEKPDSIRMDALEFMLQIAGGEISGSVKYANELCEEWVNEFEARLTGKAKPGLTTGFENLDRLLYPKQVVDGSLFVVGARPKMGKTAWLIRTVDHICGQLGHEGLMFSMEMSETQLVERSLTQIGSVPVSAMYPTDSDHEALADENRALLLATLGRFKDYPLAVSTKAAVGLMDMETTIRTQFALSNGRLRVVWVDYLTLMDVAVKGDRHDLSYAAITKRLKQIAKELGLVVFLLIQLNRSLESRPDKRPMPSDGRETGQIEQDCDYWLGIYREHVYKPEADPTFAELLLRLNRHGPAGTVYASFAGGRFDDWHGEAPALSDKVARKEYNI